MKKRVSYLTTVLLSAAVLSLSSCLKDSRYVDFSKVGTIVEFSLGGKANFGADAITDAGDTVTRQFAINVASPSAPATATKVTLSVNDPAIINAYNAADATVSYLPFPANAYSFTSTSVTIPSGQRIAVVTVTFYKSKLDPSLSYMLPIAITNAGGLNISGNKGIHYYHVIGNDFAGTYKWDYIRYNADHVLPSPSGGTAFNQAGSISPVTPTEFQMITGYNGHGVRYDVSFTRTVTGGVVSYSNWNVKFVDADVTGLWNPAGITVSQPPVFEVLDPAAKTFQMQYIDFNGTAYRYIIDKYYK
jgi:hypothetical protein